GVLAVAEGPCLVADEFQQFNTPQKSEQDPSTPASTPPLRRFRPRQIVLVRAAVLILPAGVWGQPAHMSAISFLPETEPASKSTQPIPCAECNTRFPFGCGYAALRGTSKTASMFQNKFGVPPTG